MADENVVTRDDFIKSQLGARIGALTQENLELYADVQELKHELETLKAAAKPARKPRARKRAAT